MPELTTNNVIDPDWLHEPNMQRLFKSLTAEGATARAVGGAVRDAILEIPVEDIDIAIDVEPLETIRLLEKAGIKSIPTGIGYGTVTAIINRKPYQITTLRQDLETYGRKADVKFIMDWEADAKRRDFTINAIYANPDGTLIDPCNGIADLENNDVKFIGNAEERVQEDYLRILRFFRFTGRFSPYYLDHEGLEACHKYASKLSTLSKERVTEEFTKILMLETPTDVLIEMGPELEQIFAKPIDIGALLKLEYFEAVWDYEVKVFTRLAVLIDDVNDIRLLQFSKEGTKLLKTLIEHKHETSIDHNLYLYKYGKDITTTLLFMIAAQDPHRLYPRLAPMLEDCDKWEEKKFPLRGEDLMELGVSEGEELGKYMDKVERWWIRKKFKPDRKACVAYGKRLMKK